MTSNAQLLQNIQVELNLRKRGRGPCGQYSLSNLPRCPVVYEEENKWSYSYSRKLKKRFFSLWFVHH